MAKYKLMYGDCLERMKEIPDKSVDLVVTDPPYKVITGGRKSGFSHNTGNIFKDSEDGKIFKFNEIDFRLWAAECFRLLKDKTHFYTFTNNLNLSETLVICDEIGFKFHNLLLWKKNNVLTNRWYMKNCEYILFFRKGKSKVINNPSTKQIIEINNPRNKSHPVEKPFDLMEVLISNSSMENDLILDPFMGTGATGMACKNLKRNFIGIEKDKAYFRIAKERIRNHKNEM